MSQAWTIQGSDGQPIYGDTHVPHGETIGTLLVAHGFKGYKDYGFFPRLAQVAGEHGLVAHRFNFSHSGMTNAIETFERADLFEHDTWGRQIADLRTVAEAARAGQLPGESGGHVQVWFGHSRGGLTVTLAASRAFAEMDAARPTALAIAATPDSACSLDEDQRDALRRRGFLESPSSRTGQVLRVGRAWLDEIENAPDAFDPLLAVKQIGCPMLIVHGDEDPTVPVDAAKNLAAEAGQGRATLDIIEGAQHTFNCPNPLPDDEDAPEATRRMIQVVCDFAAAACRV